MRHKSKYINLLVAVVLSIITVSCSKSLSFTKPKCYAIGSARSVMITEVAEAPNTYKVTVRGNNPCTVLLTQRPARSTKVVDTKSFLDQWNKSYKKSSPNVTFTSVSSNRTATNALVLSNPNYDEETNTVTFDATPVSNQASCVEAGVYNNVTITYDTQRFNSKLPGFNEASDQ